MELKKIYRNISFSLILGLLLIFFVLIIVNTIEPLYSLNVNLFHLIYPLCALCLIFINLLIFNFCIKRFRIIFYLWLLLTLFTPLIIPSFVNSYTIFYSIWIFILSSTTIGTVVFHDFCIYSQEIRNKNLNGHQIIYQELKYYLDKLALAWLTLGSVFTVIATLLWTDSPDLQGLSGDEKNYINLFMLFSFGLETILVGVFVGIPILKKMNKSRDIIIEKS